VEQNHLVELLPAETGSAGRNTEQGRGIDGWYSLLLAVRNFI